MIDFTPVRNGEKKLIDLWREQGITPDDLRAWTNESIDHLIGLFDGLTDADVVFEPEDPDALDRHAEGEERTMGWNLGHLVAHVTASSEEGAAFSSALARGVPNVEHRPRYETPWEEITTIAHARQRLEESRRMRLAFLDTWPDEPHFDNFRAGTSERFDEYFGQLNAPAAFLMGLAHEIDHYEQFAEVKRQALAARQQA